MDAIVLGKLAPFDSQWHTLLVTRMIERGIRVPDDVAAVSILDSPNYEYARPPVSAVRMGLEEMGRKMARLLISSLEAERNGDALEPASRRVMVEPELIRRATS